MSHRLKARVKGQRASGGLYRDDVFFDINRSNVSK